MQLKKLLNLLILIVTVVLTTLVAMADTVDNPGALTIFVDTGSYIQIKQNTPINFGGSDPPSAVSGMVDASGNLTLPASQTTFQPTVFVVFGQTITAQLIATQDGSGSINPITGDATATLTLRVKISADILPDTCQIPPTTITLTSGTSGSLTGAPYSSDDGTAALVSNNFTVPAASGCGLLEGVINLFFGLPSTTPSDNKVQLVVYSDPVLSGS